MKWILVVDSNVDLSSLTASLSSKGIKVLIEEDSVPMGNDLLVAAEGPEHLEKLIQGISDIKESYPSSSMGYMA